MLLTARQRQLAFARLDRPPDGQQAAIDRQQDHADRQRVAVGGVAAGGAQPRPGLLGRVGDSAKRTVGVWLGHDVVSLNTVVGGRWPVVGTIIGVSTLYWISDAGCRMSEHILSPATGHWPPATDHRPLCYNLPGPFRYWNALCSI
jgi:hypothetical protein